MDFYENYKFMKVRLTELREESVSGAILPSLPVTCTRARGFTSLELELYSSYSV